MGKSSEVVEEENLFIIAIEYFSFFTTLDKKSEARVKGL